MNTSTENGRQILYENNGKDIVVIATKEDLSTPSNVTLPEPPAATGLVNPDGTINWACPCLGGMAAGPCGTKFREAFSCFHYSESEPKGSECYEKFSEMQECMGNYPELYGRDDDGDDEENQLPKEETQLSKEETPREAKESASPQGDGTST